MTVAIFDSALALRASGQAAITSTTNETGLNVDVRFLQPISWVICVTALDAASADETYVFALQVSDVVGGTYTTVATHTWPRARSSGKVVIPVSAHAAVFQDADCDWIRVSATLGGTTPSITYFSYLTKNAENMGYGDRVGTTAIWT
jgi:hypothetical protein